MLSLMKNKGEEIKSYRNINVRKLSPMKDKGEDVESWNIKARTLSPMKT